MRAATTTTEIEPGRALEVVILWGEESVLHAAHLSPPRSFMLGEGDGVDYTIGEECLGAPRFQLVRCDGEESFVAVPPGAVLEVARAGAFLTVAELEASGLLLPSATERGARELRVSVDLAVRITYRGFSFVVRDLPAERIVMPGVLSSIDLSVQKWTLASMAAHGLVFFVMYFLAPPSIVRSIDVVNTDSRLVKYAIDVNELPPPPPVDAADGGKDGKAHEGDVGKIGRPDPKQRCRDCRAHAKPTPAPALSREQQKAQAFGSGVAAVLNQAALQLAGADSHFAAANALDGEDAQNLLALFGPNVGEAEGLFGLGPVGSGRGGGGDGKGTLGVGDVGTVGRGSGGDGGYGQAGLAKLGGRKSRVPRISSPVADIVGSLSKETVRRTIGLHVNEVRHCYTQALTGRPDLQGRVLVQFAIAPTGSVMKAFVKDSSLGDPATADCIARVVGRIQFPAPEGGVVMVSYPFVLSQVGN